MKKIESLFAPFCDTEEDLFEVTGVVSFEKLKGATKIGVYGSRGRGTHKPDSDFDMLVVNPYTLQSPGPEFWLSQDKGSERVLNKLDPRFMSADSLYYGKVAVPWIQILRFTPDNLDDCLYVRKVEWVLRIVNDTQWIWIPN